MSRSIAPILLIFLAAFLPFVQVLSFGFAWDDYPHLVENVQLNSLSGLADSLVSPTRPGNLYRPVFIFSLGLSKLIFGLNPLFYHLTNLLLHALVSILIYVFLKAKLDKNLALVASLVFAVHPVHTEVIANISFRTELLHTFFGLTLAIAVGTSTDKLSKYSGILFGALFAALAFLSKESGIVWLLVGLIWHLGQVRKDVVIGSMLGLGAAIALRIKVLGSFIIEGFYVSKLDNLLVDFSTADRVLAGLALLGRYLYHCFIPLDLHSDYSFPVFLTLATKPFSSVYFYLFLLFCILSLYLGFRKSQLQPLKLAAIALVLFLPSSNILFPVGTIFADRLAYSPSFAVVGFATLVIGSLLPKQLFRKLVFGVVLLVFSLTSFNYSAYWKDNLTISFYEISKNWPSSKIHYRHGLHFFSASRYEEAKAHLLKSLALYPGYAKPYIILARISFAEKKRDQAVEYLHLALEREPYNPSTLTLLGQVSLDDQNYPLAEEYLLRALKQEPKEVSIKKLLHFTYEQLGKTEAAAAILEELN